MAKLTGKAKAAFLARMARGRKARGRKSANPRKRAKARRRRNPGLLMPTALVVNPEKRTMAKTRRRKHARKNPRRKHARRVRRRRNIIVANPKRRHGRRHRRNALVLNPVSMIKDLAKQAIPAVAGGFAANFIDGKFLGHMGAIPRTLGKVGLALGIGMIGKRFAPAAAASAMAGVLGAIGGDLGARMAGGLPSIPAQKATKAGLAAMAADDEAIGALLQGMGIVVQGLGEGEDGIAGYGALLQGDEIEGMGEDSMAPGMAAYTDGDPSSYSGGMGGYGDMEINGD